MNPLLKSEVEKMKLKDTKSTWRSQEVWEKGDDLQYRYRLLSILEDMDFSKVLAKITAFIGEPEYAYSVDVSEYSSSGKDVRKDVLFVAPCKYESGKIYGTFIHCNYKMVWNSAKDFQDYLGFSHFCLNDDDDLERVETPDLLFGDVMGSFPSIR